MRSKRAWRRDGWVLSSWWLRYAKLILCWYSNTRIEIPSPLRRLDRSHQGCCCWVIYLWIIGAYLVCFRQCKLGMGRQLNKQILSARSSLGGNSTSSYLTPRRCDWLGTAGNILGRDGARHCYCYVSMFRCFDVSIVLCHVVLPQRLRLHACGYYLA